MGYDEVMKTKISQEVLNEAKNSVTNLKNFIDLPNLDKDIIIEKNVEEQLKNGAEEEEFGYAVITEVDVRDEKEGLFVEGEKVEVDDSIASSTDFDESEPEIAEDEQVLICDGESKLNREYTSNCCIPHSSKSDLSFGGRREKNDKSAGSEFSDEGPG
jgi:hypothetical protein